MDRWWIVYSAREGDLEGARSEEDDEGKNGPDKGDAGKKQELGEGRGEAKQR